MFRITVGNRQLRWGAIEIFLFIYAVLISINGVFSVSIMGIPLFSMYFLILSLSFALIFILRMRIKNKYFSDRWIFVCIIFMCFIMSILQGWDMFPSIYNAFLYGTPFLLVALPSYRKIDIKTCIAFVRVMVLIGAVISILVYLGVINPNLANDSIKLNIRVVDNSISLLGITVSLYQIIGEDDNKNRWAHFFLVLSYLIAFFGQSRARFILAVVITAIFVLYGLLKGGRQRNNIIVLVIIVFIIVLFILNGYYDVIMHYMSLSFDKFDTIMEDASSEYRMKEMQSHIELLKDYPAMGIGCGALNHEYYTNVDDIFYGHCMLTSFWALNGLFIGSVMLFSLIGTVIKSVILALRYRTLKSIMALTLALTILFLATTSAGFAKYSTHFMMLLLGCCFADTANGNKPRI